MKTNIKRRMEMAKDAVPPLDSLEHDEYVKKMADLKKKYGELSDEYTAKSWKKITNSLKAQYLSNSELITEKTLRHFLQEFNTRAWKHGLHSMPTMFNIMEAFFIYHKPEVYFELIEEENYNISFFNFIDFLTSSEFTDNKAKISNNLTEDIIYNFNFDDNYEEIKFNCDNQEEFIVAGISMVRRKNEITVVLIAGKPKLNEFDKKKHGLNKPSENPNKSKLISEFLKDLESNEINYEYLDDEKKYIKVLVAGRIDLDTMSIDAKYIAEETTHTFSVLTDEIDGFIGSDLEFKKKEYKELYQKMLNKVSKFDAIFEILKLSLYLPYFFNLHEELIKEEMLETLFQKEYSSPISKRKYKDTFGQKASKKPIYSLAIKTKFPSDIIKLKDSHFKIETSGHWKEINEDAIGQDKRGNPTKNRTWVNMKNTWFEANEKDLIIKREKKQFSGKNAGNIYITRTPTMGQNIFKIGLTQKDAKERIKQLSNTSVPDKFYVAQEWNVKDCFLAEKRIHDLLNEYRLDPRREFFEIDYDEAIQFIKLVIDDINGN